MIARYILLISLLASFSVSTAQINGILAERVGSSNSSPNIETTIILGKIVDSLSNEPIEFGTITLFSFKDSLGTVMEFSDANGAFSIETNLNFSFLQIDFLAYSPKIISRNKLIDSQNKINLGTIELVPRVEMLKVAEVRAEKSTIMMSLDKKVFNVGKDLVSEGGTAEDILKNVPGVWVDINGNVSLRSSGGVRILLNGQASLLISGENSDGLRQIQAKSIERIELITNPSARYEAAGTAGIINIVLKKNDGKGLNGAVSANLGHPNNFGLGMNLNFQKNKINFFGGLGTWIINRPGMGNYRNQFYNLENPDSTLFSNMNRIHERRSAPLNIQLGTDYYLNKSNTLTASFSFRGSKDKNSSNLVYQDGVGSINKVHLITDRQENEIGNEYNINSFLRHRKVFSKKNHQLTTDIQYEKELDKEYSAYEEYYFDSNSQPLDTLGFNQLIDNEASNQQLIFKSDYVLPIGKSSKFEGGFHVNYRTINDKYEARQIVNDMETLDSNFTNDFNFREIIHGIYANFGSEIGEFSFQAGLRGEHASVSSTLMATEGVPRDEYINLFPSAFIGYNLSNQRGLQLSYSRRIERPTILDLTPFLTLRDRRNIWRGNPNIRPEYTHAFELGFIQYWKGGTFSAISYFRKTEDVIKRIQRVDPNFPETTITQAENLAFKKNFGIELAYSFSLTKWWKLNGDVNIFHSFSEGTYEHFGRQVYVGGKSFSLTSKTISRFTFWDKLNAQMTLSYAAPRTTTQGVNRAVFATDIAASMDLLKNNSTITLSISDLFNTRRQRSFSEDDTFYSEENFLWQSRAIVLSFHYRINQHKKQSQIYSSPIKDDDKERF